jgi:hypothetical protein
MKARQYHAERWSEIVTLEPVVMVCTARTGREVVCVCLYVAHVGGGTRSASDSDASG